MPIKLPVLGGGGVDCQFYFYGRGGFSETKRNFSHWRPQIGGSDEDADPNLQLPAGFSTKICGFLVPSAGPLPSEQKWLLF